MDQPSRPAAHALPDDLAGHPVRSRSNLRSQDLVSLPVLRALLEERSVTRAAEVVGLTQPAVSNALARLRRRFGDDLLVRVGREYELTPLGRSLLDRTESAFDALERLFEHDFDPVTSTRIFSLALSDYAILVLAEPLMRMMHAEAPGVRLNFSQLTSALGDFELTLRQSDGVIVPPGYMREHPSTELITDRWVCVVARENRRIRDAVTIADLADMPLIASFDQAIWASSPPVRQLRALGVEPHVAVSVESFLTVPFLVAGTDRIAFLQHRLAQRLTGLAGIRLLPSPLPNAEHHLALYWEGIKTKDPGHQWFRDMLGRAAASIEEA
jgi:DNA-binding transcriptional LysR family regulator